MKGAGASSPQGGFVLIAVLWVIAILALVLVITTEWTSRAITAAIHLSDRTDAERQVFDMQQEILYRFASSHLSGRGLELLAPGEDQSVVGNPLDGPPQYGAGYIALDGRPYVTNGLTVQVQDARGLVSVNGQAGSRLGNMLLSLGLDIGTARGMVDKLLDYESESSLQHPDGAGPADYAAADRPPPRRDMLITPYELSKVLGWEGLPSLRRDPLADDLSVFRTDGLDPGTASRAALLTMPGIGAVQADQVIIYRQQTPIASELDLETALHGDFETSPLALFYFPAPAFRVEITPANRVFRQRLEFHFAPQDPEPWHIDYAIELRAGQPSELEPPQPLPEPVGSSPLSTDTR